MIKHIDINLLYLNTKENFRNNLITFYDNNNEYEYGNGNGKENNNTNTNTNIIFYKEFPEIQNKINEEKNNNEIFIKKNDKFFLVKNIFTNFIKLVLNNRKKEIISDNISYWLLIIVYNM